VLQSSRADQYLRRGRWTQRILGAVVVGYFTSLGASRPYPISYFFITTTSYLVSLTDASGTERNGGGTVRALIRRPWD